MMTEEICTWISGPQTYYWLNGTGICLFTENILDAYIGWKYIVLCVATFLGTFTYSISSGPSCKFVEIPNTNK